MRFSTSEILSTAEASGFNATVVLSSHPSLRGKWVLKGGTALNLFVLRYPRLSVDIDLN